MSCNHPIRAFRSKDGPNENGKIPLVFNERDGNPLKAVLLPCGKCAGCMIDRARNWAVRCILEASLWDKNCFITLTYAPEFLPQNGTLVKEHFTLFMKRLRKKYGADIRFFQCGEYGDLHGRPHYHACLFNFDFPDKELWFKSRESGALVYKSASLSKLWPYGLCSIGDVNPASASYVAGYVLKKAVNVNMDYGERIPEYVNMSRRPGIAKGWFEKYHKDIYSQDVIVLSDSFKARPPRYFDNLYDLYDHEHMESIKKDREWDAYRRTREKYPYYNFWDKIRGLDPDSKVKYARESVQQERIKRRKRGF